MNILSVPLVELITSLASLEGMPWVEGSFRKLSYSMLGAFSWLVETRVQVTAEATQFKKAGDQREWPVLFDELLVAHRPYEVYGNGGYHRYFIDGHGEIRFSAHHSLPMNETQAAELGFVVR